MPSSLVSANDNSRLAVRDLVCVFALALAIRLIFVIFYQWAPEDAIGYDALASNLLAGNGFSWDLTPPYYPNLFRTPVYPVFLASIYAVAGHHDTVVYLVQAVIGSATCCLTYLIARRYWDRRVALIAGLLSATYLHAAYFVSAKLTETVFTFLMCGAIYFVIVALQKQNWRLMVAAGLAMGLAILCRPEAMLFPLILLPLLLVPRHSRLARLKLASVLVIATFVILVPWFIRNSQVSGRRMGLVSHGPGLIFWQTTLPYFNWNTFVYGPGSEHDPLVRTLTTEQLTFNQAADLEPAFWRAGFENILRDPKAYLLRRVREYPHFWISGGSYLLGRHNRSFGEAVAQRRYPLILVKLFLIFVIDLFPLMLGLTGVFISWGRLWELLPLWAPILYVAVFRLPFDYTPRYTLPLHPYVLTFAAVGAVFLWTKFSKRRSLQSAGRYA
ncbi:MAG TPA: glycosyltransferase family 39 protein [Pyrinomonadaceae bacterium]|nr:glycosyltransferase family 39 protein [Pyrinomonadaceae bacterium]